MEDWYILISKRIGISTLLNFEVHICCSQSKIEQMNVGRERSSNSFLKSTYMYFAASCFGISKKNILKYMGLLLTRTKQKQSTQTPTSSHYINQVAWQCFCQDPKELLVANVAAYRGYVTKSRSWGCCDS